MQSVMSRVLVALGLPLVACAPEPEVQPPGKAGEPCDIQADCEEPLSCIESTCVDDTGPYLILGFPMHLDAVNFGETMFGLVTVVDREFDSDVEFTFDPFGPTPMTSILDWTVSSDSDDIVLETPPEAGAHWLRVRVIDGNGEPYENPSATQHIMVFVRDEVHPDKPLIALLSPRPDRPHVAGTDLTFEVAVLPGSFSFSEYGEPCKPLPDCPDPFAPECEDECGPVSRSGGANVYLDEDLENCVTDEPSCGLFYVGAVEEYLDAFVGRGYVPGSLVSEVGEHTFSAMLIYDYSAYPSEQAPILVSQSLEIVSE